MTSSRAAAEATFMLVGALVLAGLFCETAPSVASVTAAQGPPAGGLLPLRDQARALPRLRSLLVSRRGELLTEYYAPGVRPASLANIKSASKSILAALVGIAIDRGQIRDVKTPIVTWFPELRRDPDPRKQTITIEDLLTMRTGLASTSGRNYGAWVQSRDWVRAALARPMVGNPGGDMEYSTGTSHVLSAVLTKATGVSTWQFANDALARPLGFSLARWTQDPQGIYFGGNEMLMTPKQMLALGELFLHRGAANGRQVMSAAWVDTTCVPRTSSAFEPGRHYGYGWWIQQFDGGSACFAWGYGGQYIFVFRELDVVVVATSSTTVSEERRGHRRQLFDLIERQVLLPLRSAS